MNYRSLPTRAAVPPLSSKVPTSRCDLQRSVNSDTGRESNPQLRNLVLPARFERASSVYGTPFRKRSRYGSDLGVVGRSRTCTGRGRSSVHSPFCHDDETWQPRQGSNLLVEGSEPSAFPLGYAATKLEPVAESTAATSSVTDLKDRCVIRRPAYGWPGES